MLLTASVLLKSPRQMHNENGFSVPGRSFPIRRHSTERYLERSNNMNFEKFSKGQVALLRHIERKNSLYTNENVDLSLSDRNIQFSPQRSISAVKYWHDILREIHVTRRSGKNATVDLAGFTISLPAELRDAPIDEQRYFFQKSYDFIKERYYDGDDRFIISAQAHYDEVTKDGECTPHIHVMVVPSVRSDRYVEGWKCSCKEFCTREDLRSWHDDFQKYIDAAGIDARVKTGTTGGKNFTMEFYKEHRSEIINERRLSREIEMKREELAQIEREIDHAHGYKRERERSISF